MNNVIDILNDLISRYPALSSCSKTIEEAYNVLRDCYEHEGKLLVCGNGGSDADSSHIVGELMKGFRKKRELPSEVKERLIAVESVRGEDMGSSLQGALPAVSLGSHHSLISAVSNDIDSNLIFAQQVLGYGRKGDVLLGISTSGNAENVINAMIMAKAAGMKVVGLTGADGGKMKKFCDTAIRVPANSVPFIQELHLPVYHALCAMLEEYFYG